MFAIRDVHVRRSARRAMLAGLIMFLPALAGAQAVIDAGRVEFTPSADHDALSGGVPIVTSYQLRIFPAGSTQMAQSVELGKPSPQTDGFIRLDFLRLLSTPLSPAQQYEARVAAVGPFGAGTSTVSNQFSFTPTCAPALSATSASLAATASSASVTVTAATACPWTASSPAAWLTVTSGASGTGTGVVAFNATANTTATSRSATTTIATRAFTVTQAGSVACTSTISPSSRTSGAAGETTTVSVTAGSSCAWTAVSETTWLTVTSGASGVGNGSVRIVVAANTATTVRSGTATIAGRIFTVSQSGAACTYTVTPVTISAGSAGRTGTISVTTAAGCTWSATGVPAWITVPAAAQTGPGTLAYTVAPNTAATRNAALTLAGRTVVIFQSGGGTALSAPAGLRVLSGSEAR